MSQIFSNYYSEAFIHSGNQPFLSLGRFCVNKSRPFSASEDPFVKGKREREREREREEGVVLKCSKGKLLSEKSLP